MKTFMGKSFPPVDGPKEDCMKWLKTAAVLKPPVAGGVPEPEAAGGRLRAPDCRF
jgi:hypothetical protein